MNSERKASIVKIETTSGTEAASMSNTTDAIQLVNFAWGGPAKVVSDELEYAAPFYGARDKIVVHMTRDCGFEVPLMGGGAAGTNYPAPLLAIYRACGLAAVEDAGVSWTYTPVNSGEESATFKLTEDTLLRKMIGSRGNVRWVFAKDKVPRGFVTMLGKYSAAADAAIPSVTLATLTKPVGFSKSNTTVSIGGYALKCSGAEVDGGQMVEYRNHAGVEEIAVVNRKPSAKLNFELPTVAQKDVYTLLESSTIEALSIVHGIVAGNIATLAAPYAQLVDISETKEAGRIFAQATYELKPGLSGAAPFTLVIT